MNWLLAVLEEGNPTSIVIYGAVLMVVDIILTICFDRIIARKDSTKGA